MQRVLGLGLAVYNGLLMSRFKIDLELISEVAAHAVCIC